MTGVKMYGVLVADRDRENVAYALHPECLAAVRELAGDGDGITTRQRLVEIAPATTDPREVCNHAACGRPLSEPSGLDR